MINLEERHARRTEPQPASVVAGAEHDDLTHTITDRTQDRVVEKMSPDCNGVEELAPWPALDINDACTEVSGKARLGRGIPARC